MKDINERIRDLGIQIPRLPEPKFSYIPGKVVGNLVYVSGQTPTRDGQLLYRGKLGRNVTVEDGYSAARIAALNCVAELRAVLGDLNRVKSIVKVSGYVASEEGFVKQPSVVNGASDLFVEIWEESGKHARKAVGVNELPEGAPVEIEVIAEIA